MSNEEILNRYVEWKSIKNERSSVCYAWVTKRFYRFVGKPVHRLTIDDIISYQAMLKKKYSDATCANEAAALRSFFTFTNKRGITHIDIEEIGVPRIKEKVPIYVVQDEFKILCDIAEFTDPFMHLAIRLLWFTAVRVSELCDMTMDHIDTTQKMGIIMTRKSYKPKQVFWDDDTNKIIEGIKRNYPSRSFLFESPRGGAISTRQVERWIAELVSKAGFKRHITPHSFRHGATKEWLNNGVDLPAIKDLLGHSSLMSIEKYTKRLDNDIAEKGREGVRQRFNSLKFNKAHSIKVDNF